MKLEKITDGTSQWDVIDFNPDANGEQYTSGAIAAKKENKNKTMSTNIGLHYAYDNYGNAVLTSMGKISDDGGLFLEPLYIQSSQDYDANGNYLVASSDQRDKTTNYSVDSITGLTKSVTDPKANKTEYSYYAQNNLLEKVRAQSSAGAVENSYGYDEADRLNKITHNGFDYTFARDGYGNTTIINVGSQNLITNIFASGNGNLNCSKYGNGFKLEYLYDEYDRVTSLKKNGATAYQYLYDARGNLAKVTDKTSGTDLVTDFSYDIGDRLIKKASSDGSQIRYSYDNMDRSTNTIYTFEGQTKSAAATYGVDNRKAGTTLLNNGTVTRAYDSLNREYITDVNAARGKEPTLRTQRSYVNVLNSRTTTLVDTYTNYKRVEGSNTALSQYRYTYDDNGNISTITDKDGNVTTYTYDQLNQLVRADDQKAKVSTTYSYDVGGNITDTKTYAYTTGALGAATGTITNAYENTNWKDLLTSYNGQKITYDEIGNPLSYRDSMSFTWEGRQLKTAVANGKNVSYTYNNDGIRTSKTVDGVTTDYFLDGSTVIAQQTGNDTMWFLYDSDGTRVGFSYKDTDYFYTKNAQGDVTGIVDKDCSPVVEYSYDAWGKLLSTTGSMANTIGKLNPFLYRGYYFDAETGLYYLNSRYYDAQTGRFINEDGQFNPHTGMTGNNLFAYCNNNPANLKDSDGNVSTADDGSGRWVTYTNGRKYEGGENTYATTKIDPKPKALPKTGKPNSKGKLYDNNGNLKQERDYGPDGNAVLDKDYSHGGVGHTFPHFHDWDWTKPPKDRRQKAHEIVGLAFMVIGVIGVAVLVADDLTGIGAADDGLIAPIAGLIGKGAAMLAV